MPEAAREEYRKTLEDWLQNLDQNIASGYDGQASVVQEALARENELRDRATNAMDAAKAKERAKEQKRADRRSFEGIQCMFVEGGEESG